MAKITDEIRAREIIETYGLDDCVLYLLGVEIEREANYILDIVGNKQVAMNIILRQFRLNGNEKLTYIDNFTELTDSIIIGILSGTEKPKQKGSTGEIKIEQYLIKNRFTYIKEFSFKELGRKRFDFYLPKENMCIEFDGIQHYEAIGYFGGIDTFIATQNSDKAKNDYCKQNKIKLIRISYTDKNNIDEILDLNLKRV